MANLFKGPKQAQARVYSIAENRPDRSIIQNSGLARLPHQTMQSQLPYHPFRSDIKAPRYKLTLYSPKTSVSKIPKI